MTPQQFCAKADAFNEWLAESRLGSYFNGNDLYYCNIYEIPPAADIPAEKVLKMFESENPKYNYMTQQTASALQIKLAAEDLIAKMQAAVPTFMRDGNKVHYYTANDRRQLAIQYAAIAAELMLSETDTNHAYQYNRWQDTLTYLQVVANETEG